MKSFRIVDEFGEVCVNGTLAKVFADSNVLPFLRSGEKVIIDFTGVSMASSSFVNSIVFNTCGYEVVPQQVTFVSNYDLIKSMLDAAQAKLEKELD